MGGGVYEDGWGTYPWSQASPLFHRPQNTDDPTKKKKTLKVVPVTDGGDPVREAPVKREAEPAIGSRFTSEDAAATKIQAVFRGHVVRRTKPLRDLRVIRKVEEELEVFENKLQVPAQRQKLYNDSTERLRWTEGVMALLLRLDSLQGVHPEVRVIRRALTKELIRFQEAIDEMSAETHESDYDSEVLMDVDTKEQVLTMERPLTVEEREVELANVLHTDTETLKQEPSPVNVSEERTLNQEASLVDVSGECTPYTEVIPDPISEEFASVTPAMNDAEMCEQASVTGRGEEAENMVVEEEAGRSALDTFRSGDVCSDFREEDEGFMNPASNALLLEPPWLQASLPQPSTDGLSDRALLLQVLEENRKLKDVVGKVLQWGNQKDHVIQNLLRRVEHLEERQPLPEVVHCEESDVPKKKNDRWFERGRKTGKTRYPFGYVDLEDSLSAGSSDWFSDDFLW